MENESGIRIEKEGSLLKNMIYSIHKQSNGKEELFIAGIDFGGRMYIVEWLNEKTFIAKRPNCMQLMGARGLGMVEPFSTEYYLAVIQDEKIPDGWKNWKGYITFTHRMECGRQWRKGIKELKKLVE